MLTARSSEELRLALATLGRPALVPTMGALHDGHLALIRAARAAGGPVAASIFVNPLQFGPAEDFSRYPRDEDGDLKKLEAAGCALVWLPDAVTMVGAHEATTITVAGPALRWEGALRPGHFAGVATIVAKLFGQIGCHAAYFGEKDWQQIQVIMRMVADLAMPVTIVPVPTVREPDGLALSSRNRFLTEKERAAAPALYRALANAAGEIASGVDVDVALEAGRDAVRRAGLAEDYFALVAAHTLEPLAHHAGPARLIAAARCGAVRLLDNVAVG